MTAGGVYYNDNNKNAVAWMRELMASGLIAEGVVDGRSITEVRGEDVVRYRRAHFFAGVCGWEYALRLAGWDDARPVWTGSAPCFPAGVLVLTADGYKVIENVVVGDLVLTHKGRWRPVTHVGSEVSECVTVKGQGHFGLTCTPDHPFYVGEEEWSPASDLRGRRWATVTTVPMTPMPPLVSSAAGVFFDKNVKGFRVKGELNGQSVYIGVYPTEAEAIAARKLAVQSGTVAVRGADAVDPTSAAFARFLGYWVGDGWLSGDSVFLCGAREDTELLNGLFRDVGMRSTAYIERTSSRIRCGSKHLVAWLRDNFGEYAHAKKIPAWLHGMPAEYRAAFLDGYLLADGHEEINKSGSRVRVFTTTSRALAVGVRVLLNQSGVSASIRVTANSRETVIEGRTVNERPYYRVSAYDSSRSFRFGDTHGWGVVRSVEAAERQRVYNLAVADDESYTADAIVVHNCQPFSSAGKRKGTDDERHLWPEMFRIVRECRPPTIFGEQVASNDGLAWLDGVFADLEAEGYACAAADLCAAGVGAPHIRQRLYWVATLPGARNGGMGNPHEPRPQRRSVRGSERADKRAAGSAGDDGRVGNADDAQGRRRRGTKDGGGGGKGIREEGAGGRPADDSTPRGMAHDTDDRRDIQRGTSRSEDGAGGSRGNEPTDGRVTGYWSDFVVIPCRDGKFRRAEPRIFPLAPGLPKGVVRSRDPGAPLEADNTSEARGMRLHGYGNAIVPQVAAKFIRAFLEAEKEMTK